MANCLSVYLLGLVDFDSAAQLQDRLVYELSGRDDTAGVLILCGHPPTITIGREGRRQEIGADEGDLRAYEIEIRWVSRGGGCFLHLPGQLSINLLIPLQRLHLGLQDYRLRLERAVQTAAAEFQVQLDRKESTPGLFGRGGEVGFFGAAVKAGVTCHGISLNVTTDGFLFRLAHIGQSTPGLPKPPIKVTSLEGIRAGTVTMNQVRESIIRQICVEFNYELQHIQTGHPLLKRTTHQATPVG